MIPTAFYEIKRLPYNRNKKVDYRELERMVPKTGEQEKAETELEDFVARICENILKLKDRRKREFLQSGRGLCYSDENCSNYQERI